jgi:hypothetical protein
MKVTFDTNQPEEIKASIAEVDRQIDVIRTDLAQCTVARKSLVTLLVHLVPEEKANYPLDEPALKLKGLKRRARDISTRRIQRLEERVNTLPVGFSLVQFAEAAQDLVRLSTARTFLHMQVLQGKLVTCSGPRTGRGRAPLLYFKPGSQPTSNVVALGTAIHEACNAEPQVKDPEWELGHNIWHP